MSTKIIAAQWFTRNQIQQAFDCTKEAAEALCDKTSGGRATGGYGMNIVKKSAGSSQAAQDRAAERLMEVR